MSLSPKEKVEKIVSLSEREVAVNDSVWEASVFPKEGAILFLKRKSVNKVRIDKDRIANETCAFIVCHTLFLRVTGTSRTGIRRESQLALRRGLEP